MSIDETRVRARQLARESIERGDPTGWFERLYQEGEAGTAVVPWAENRANPNLTEWWATEPGVQLKGARALVVGCGLGDDAEQLAAWGAEVTAFDVSPTAIAAARRRFPESKVDYQVGDLLADPVAEWVRRFEFVFESYTLQALPVEVRAQAMRNVEQFLAPGGALLIIARGRDESDALGEMPWPLTDQELREFEHLGLLRLGAEDYMDGETRRFRVLYRRL